MTRALGVDDSHFVRTVTSDVLEAGGGQGAVARGDHHLCVSGDSTGRLRVRPDREDRRHGVRPAIDAAIESAAATVTDPLSAVVLTGRGTHGAPGVRAVHGAGGAALAQDEATSAVFGVPERAVETGCVDDVLSADRLEAGSTDAVRRGT